MMTAKRFLSPAVLAKLQTIYNQVSMPNLMENAVPFSHSLREFLEQYGEEIFLSPGEILFVQDELGENMYWIESGTLAIVQGRLKNPQLLTFRRPGQIVGEIALLENIPRTATVAAMAPTRLRYLGKDKFQDMLTCVPGVGLELIRLLASRLREVKPTEYNPGFYDHLTGALSRRALDVRLQDEIERAAHYQYDFAVVFLDMDQFKQINDNYGHARGDEVLISFVQRVVADLRTTDMFFRYGGDEFILILQGVNRERGPVIIQRLIDQVCLTPISGDPPLFIAFTTGVAYFPHDGQTPEALLKVADQRLYEAKPHHAARKVTRT